MCDLQTISSFNTCNASTDAKLETGSFSIAESNCSNFDQWRKTYITNCSLTHPLCQGIFTWEPAPESFVGWENFRGSGPESASLTVVFTTFIFKLGKNCTNAPLFMLPVCITRHPVYPNNSGVFVQHLLGINKGGGLYFKM